MQRPSVVVLGAGFAGLESAFYLRHKLGERVDLTLISERDYFLFKPNTIYIPFGSDPEKFHVPLERACRRKRIDFVQARALEIDPENRRVELDGQVPRAFDYLVVATGACMRAAEIPGLAQHAVTVWTPEEMLRLREAYQRLLQKAKSGEKQRLLFLIPPNNRCSGPLYEMVLMTDTWLRRAGARDNVHIEWTTYEESYIQAFGPRLNTVVEQEFKDRGIHGQRGFVVTDVEAGRANFKNGEKRAFDLLVAFPPYVAHERYAALPSDDRGFLRVEPDSRRVRGHERIFAVGDAADFPIKQAFLALLQGDAAGDHIAAEIAGEKPEVDFEPMSMCVMEEFNKATFAQVPLEYTGDAEKPIAVDVDGEDYKVGVSPVWRAGKKLLGLYVPWRFGAGEPFHAGFAWQAMDMGLKVMSRFLAK